MEWAGPGIPSSMVKATFIGAQTGCLRGGGGGLEFFRPCSLPTDGYSGEICCAHGRRPGVGVCVVQAFIGSICVSNRNACD